MLSQDRFPEGRLPDIETHIATHFSEYLNDESYFSQLAEIDTPILYRIFRWEQVSKPQPALLFKFFRETLTRQGEKASILFQFVDLTQFTFYEIYDLLKEPEFDPTFVQDQLEQVARREEEEVQKQQQTPPSKTMFEEEMKELETVRKREQDVSDNLSLLQQRIDIIQKTTQQLKDFNAKYTKSKIYTPPPRKSKGKKTKRDDSNDQETKVTEESFALALSSYWNQRLNFPEPFVPDNQPLDE